MHKQFERYTQDDSKTLIFASGLFGLK